MKKFLALSLALFATPVFAAPQELNAAIDAYLEQDFSQMSVIERYAATGDPKAVSVLGMAHLHGLGRVQDEARGVSLLEQAARAGDRPAAVQLARRSRIAGDPVRAAQWFAYAYGLGETPALDSLRDLPPEAVREAGAGALIGLDRPEPAPAVEYSDETPGRAEPSSEDIAAEQSRNALASEIYMRALAEKTAKSASIPDDGGLFPREVSKEKARAAGDGRPVRLAALYPGAVLRFSVDTELDDRYDVVLSCNAVFLDVFARFEGDSSIPAALLTAAKADVDNGDSLAEKLAREMGIDGATATSAFAQHRAAYDANPFDGPIVDYCSQAVSAMLR